MTPLTLPRAVLRASGTGAAPPPPPSNIVRFDYPRMNGEFIDWCVTWATNCGIGLGPFRAAWQGLGETR
ncbi:hypothetical protein N0B44_23310 [Roseibacterium beibuensis]|uniref:Uncharacterized protein n=1 Tax=[Roseibacterium] beibuensis TaxID=1193142 RepID=A0ABP9LID7_9RHOB|nr:hypothetical protein [Roseibacterium beibuensis]MCS6625848.1 hypothetical protein [Roseibacterium beibuensis]